MPTENSKSSELDELDKQLLRYKPEDRERMKRRIMRTKYPIGNIEWYGPAEKFCCNAGIRVVLPHKYICLGCGKHHERKESA